ncbi:6-hydroxymethylpterin diphosphokinase MptE-like protein [Tritonibacter scottomollicae]|uniref:6-hydroxymethylpterin diphosphokinase MptE-like protein n=1 Tax=Tritonibacter scottomollicae TaxID=483013 RepID=UPI003BAA8D0F
MFDTTLGKSPMMHRLQNYIHEHGACITNAFDVSSWARTTTVDEVSLTVFVRRGAVKVELIHIAPDDQRRVLDTLGRNAPGVTSSSAVKLKAVEGFLLPHIQLLEENSSFDLYFETADIPYRQIAKVNYISCTFKRGEYIRKNAEIFRDYCRSMGRDNGDQLTVVDNGSDSGVISDAQVNVILNRNTGGAGGFGRGMYETCYGSLRDRAFTHVCLMDDDIYLHQEMFFRTSAMARFLKPGYHLGAPMYPAFDPSAPPKRSATFGHRFKGTLHPADEALGVGLNTQDVARFSQIPHDQSSTGWWWDCISVDDIHKAGLPYPFFVKMDDVEYGLRLRQHGVQVVIPSSFWVMHDDFEEKYSALMQYFRFRNRWVLLAQKNQMVGRIQFWKEYSSMVLGFLRSLRYEHAELLLDAFDHYRQGPEWLVRNETKLLKKAVSRVKREKHAPMVEADTFGMRVGNGIGQSQSRWRRRLTRLTMNNHFLGMKEKIVIDISSPYELSDFRRAGALALWHKRKSVGMQLTRQSWRMLRDLIRLGGQLRHLVGWRRKSASYQQVMTYYTSPAFWRKYVGETLGEFSDTPARWARPHDSSIEHELVALRQEIDGLRCQFGGGSKRFAVSEHVQHLLNEGLLETEKLRQDLQRANDLGLNLLRNRHKGQRCFILGNGPSLSLDDIERLNKLGEVTFASNKIYLLYPETRWRPTYYTVEDTMVLRNHFETLRSVSGSIKIFPDNAKVYGFHDSKTVFVNLIDPKSFVAPLVDPEFPAFSTDLSKGLAWGSTVTYSQIQLACFMGFSEIYLLGIDHSYKLPGKKDGNKYISEGEVNHFHPDYRKPGELWHEPNLEVLEHSYAAARRACEGLGVEIVNASRSTKLDVFERGDLDIVLSRRS